MRTLSTLSRHRFDTPVRYYTLGYRFSTENIIRVLYTFSVVYMFVFTVFGFDNTYVTLYLYGPEGNNTTPSSRLHKLLS